MGFKCGIVGLPNVGKSTLFNALTATAIADAENFPFCTIEPNTGKVSVPDKRLWKIANISKSKKIIPAQIEFVDIAGLVKGASKGEGLGNQFLANIREVDAIAHVVRCFNDDQVVHVQGAIDPINDAQVVETELMLADIESLNKRSVLLEKKIRGNDKEAKNQFEMVEKALVILNEGRSAREYQLEKGEEKAFRMLQLLTAKPVLYVCNVEEAAAAEGNALSAMVVERAIEQKAQAVIISAKIEDEVSNLPNESEKNEYLESMGLAETGLSRVIRAGYNLLDLLTFFTSGPKESRAWTLCNSARAPEAAGVIHTDFERGFIKAETISFEDFIDFNGEQGAKEAGKMRQEGKDYFVVDGDIILFKFNV